VSANENGACGRTRIRRRHRLASLPRYPHDGVEDNDDEDKPKPDPGVAQEYMVIACLLRSAVSLCTYPVSRFSSLIKMQPRTSSGISVAQFKGGGRGATATQGGESGNTQHIS